MTNRSKWGTINNDISFSIYLGIFGIWKH